MHTLHMPENFLWGCASAAYQVEGAHSEGGKGMTNWDRFTRTPGATFQGTTGEVAVDHYHRYKEDIALMAELGLKTYRFSIAWARIFPQGNGAVNEQGLRFYEDIIDECLKYEIQPMVTLYHWDLPQALEDAYGGWENRRIVDDYVHYATTMFERFKGKVKYWITLNEQNIFTTFGWLLAMHPPGKFDRKKVFYQVNHHASMAHAKAVLAFKKIIPDGKIGASFAYEPSYAFDCHPQNAMAKMNFDELNNYWWLDVYGYGRYPAFTWRYLENNGLLPQMESGDAEILLEAAQAVDFIGINYYKTKVAEYNPHKDGALPYGRMNTEGVKGTADVTGVPGLYKNPHNPYLETTDWDWTIDASGLRFGCREVTSRYHLPIIISENGLGAFDKLEDGRVHDPYRIAYLERHIAAVREAISEGCDVIAYCVWSFTDLLSWLNGYQKRYGLVYVDRAEAEGASLGRYKKDSFYWYQRVIASNGAALK